MSANEPTNQSTSPVVTAPGETRPVADTTVVKYDVKRLIAAVLLVSVTSLLLMCLVSGRWMKTSKVGGQWDEFSIWGTCQCIDINDSVNCGERERKTNAAKSFSIIAAAFEFFAVIVLLLNPSGSGGKIPVAIFSFIAACSLIITIAIWGDLFNKRMCNIKLKTNYHLDWAYGIRIAEFVFVLVLLVAVLVKPHGPGLVVFAILILYLTVFTTTSRGWASWKNHLNGGVAQTQEFGLWDYCTCTRAGQVPCGTVRHLLRASEAFEIIAVALSLVLTVCVVTAAPRGISAGLAWFVFICQILPWIFIAAIWNQKYCGTKYKSIPSLKLAWAFGLQVALSGLMIPTAAIISILPNKQ